MVTTAKNFLAILCAWLLYAHDCQAFTHPNIRHQLRPHTQHVVQKISFTTPPATLVSLSMAKQTGGSGEEKGTNEVDYVKIAGMFVNPINPYSWFFYFIGGIYLYNAFQ